MPDVLPMLGEFSISAALLTVVVWGLWALLTGRVVTKNVLDEQRKNAEVYKDAWATERQRTEQQDRLIEQLQIVGTSVEKFFDSLPNDKGDT